MNIPNSRRMSSLGLSEIIGKPSFDIDHISCDIESFTPVELRKVIDKLRPKLYKYEMKLDHYIIEGSKTFHQILKELELQKKVTEFPTIEVHCSKIRKIAIEPEEFGF